jgi:hypothetical protein
MFPPSLPPAIRDEPKSRAEVHVYDALRDQTSRKWTAYYHVSWLGAMRTGGPPKDGEADFILTHPRFGVIVLEVKGGGIRYEGPRRQWFSRDRNGIEYEIDPINQVVRSKKVFLRKILDQTDWKSRWVQIAHAVVFPDVLATAVTLPTDLSPTIILDSSDLDRLERRLTEIALYFSKATPSDPYDDGPALVSVIERLLVPFVKFPTLGAEIEFTEKMLLKLTEEQYRLLDFLGGRRRAVIHGCAGSGKTIMAVEQARRFAELDGMKTILLCYEPHLAQDIAARLGTASDVRVQTFRDFCQHAIDPNKPCDPAADLDDLAERAIQVFDKSPESRYEAIVVDEGQDFEETWWVAIVSALSEQGVFYVFMDDNQRIKRSTAFPPIAPEHSFALHDNVRNTGTIFERMRSFYEGPTGARSRGPAGRSRSSLIHLRTNSEQPSPTFSSN